jgi:hypothetical protein
MKYKNYNSGTAFKDLFINCVIAFLLLLVIVLSVVSPDKNKKNVEAKAEFIITVTWPSDFDDDVDTYLEDPQHNTIYYLAKENGLSHLDRDDLGHSNDVIETHLGTVTYDENREIATLRGIMKGEYTLVVHCYRRNKKENDKPIPVTVQIDKINPFSTVLIKSVILEKKGDQETVCRFTLNAKGEVVEMNTLPKSIEEMGVPGNSAYEYEYEEDYEEDYEVEDDF